MVKKIYELKGGRVFINYNRQTRFDNPCRSYFEFRANFQYYADIAYWVQKETEEAVLYIINERSKICDSKNLAYTGGVALNAVINAKILKNSSFEKLYITPAAGDNGLAIGCAYYGWLEVLKQERVFHNSGSCFGKIYPRNEIEKTIENFTFYENINRNKTIDHFFENNP